MGDTLNYISLYGICYWNTISFHYLNAKPREVKATVTIPCVFVCCGTVINFKEIFWYSVLLFHILYHSVFVEKLNVSLQADLTVEAVDG